MLITEAHAKGGAMTARELQRQLLTYARHVALAFKPLEPSSTHRHPERGCRRIHAKSMGEGGVDHRCNDAVGPSRRHGLEQHVRGAIGEAERRACTESRDFRPASFCTI